MKPKFESEMVISKIIQDSDGYTSDQIAELTNFNQDTVRAALSRLEMSGEIQREFHHSTRGKYFIYVARTGKDRI